MPGGKLLFDTKGKSFSRRAVLDPGRFRLTWKIVEVKKVSLNLDFLDLPD